MKKYVEATHKVPIIYAEDLPSMATHCKQSECGMSVYRNVLVQWDEDHDERVLQFIDELPDEIRNNLAVVQEHEGGLSLLWNVDIPRAYATDGETCVDGDTWHIFSSRALLHSEDY